jgi:hypothetical protein
VIKDNKTLYSMKEYYAAYHPNQCQHDWCFVSVRIISGNVVVTNEKCSKCTALRKTFEDIPAGGV